MAAKKTTPKKAQPAKKAPAKKAAVKKVPVKKAPAKKAPVKKAPEKKAPEKKAPVKKVPEKKAPVKKAPAKKAPTKKAPAPKAAVKKAVAKPTPAKKAVSGAKALPAKKSAPVVKPAAKPVAKPAAKPAEKPVAKPVSKPAAKPAAKPVVETAAPVKNPHSPAFVKKQHQRLLDLRDSLVDSMSGMTRDTIRNAPEGSEASGSGMHQGDAGSDAYDRDFALSVLAKEQDALYEIEEALRRIKYGTYGVCELSGEKIPQPRLEAIPFARLTVQCQAQWEKEYGNRRFRPSNEVGFSGGTPLDEEDSESISLDEDDE